MESRVPLKPGFDTGMFMCAIIIHDQMQVESGWRFAVYFLEETDKFLMPMAWHTIANHLTVEHAEGRKQGGCAVAFVIVRHCPAAALLDGATRAGRIFFQPRQTQCQKTLWPELNGRSRHPQSFGDSLTEDAVCSHHDDFGPLHQSQGITSSARPCFHGSAFLWGQHDGTCGSAHYPYNRAYPTYMSSYL